MSVLGSIGTAALNIGSSFLDTYAKHRSTEILSKQQYSYQRDLRQSKYTDTMQDLRSAGLNPMLAGSTLGGSSSAFSMAQGASMDTGDVGNDILNNSQSMQRHKKEMDILNEQKNLVQAQTDEASVRMRKLDEERQNMNNFLVPLQMAQTQKALTEANSASVLNRIPDYKSKFYLEHPYLLDAEIISDVLQKGASSAGSVMDILPSGKIIDLLKRLGHGSSKSSNSFTPKK